MFFADGDELIF